MSTITKVLRDAFGEANSPKLEKRAANSYAWKTVQTAKIQLNVLATSFGGLQANVSSFRHFNTQIVPVLKVITEGTVVSRFALPGLVKAYTKLTDVSDCTEFLTDAKYFFNNAVIKDFVDSGIGSFKFKEIKFNKVLSIIAASCGAIANVTNTIELMRVWGDYHLKFLGNFGNFVARIPVYGAKPFALAGRVTVSGVCSGTLCASFFFAAVKSHIEIRALEKVPLEERTSKGELEKAYDSRNTSLAKFALYTTSLILGATNVYLIGLLGTAAFITSYREKSKAAA